VREVRLRLRDEPRGWSDLVRAAALWLLARPAIYALPAALPFLRLGQTLYHPPAAEASLARSAASMLTRVWNDALAATAIRREQGHRLDAAATRSDRWRSIRVASDATAGYLRLPMLARSDARAHLLDEASAALGSVQGYPMPLYQLPGSYERCLNASDGFPGAALLAARLFTLPTHGLLTERDLNALEHWLKSDSAARWNQPVGPDAAAIGVG
jgi:perosamine synthetase